MVGGAVKHNIYRGPPKNHPCQVWFNLVQRLRGEDLNVQVTMYDGYQMIEKAHLALNLAR